jgi:hypothetical protein
MTKENNEGLTSKVDVLICMIKGNEAQGVMPSPMLRLKEFTS